MTTPPGTAVVIVGITDITDADLNGRTGIVCKKFPFNSLNPKLTFGDIGVKLDFAPEGEPPYVNVLNSEVRPI